MVLESRATAASHSDRKLRDGCRPPVVLGSGASRPQHATSAMRHVLAPGLLQDLVTVVRQPTRLLCPDALELNRRPSPEPLPKTAAVRPYDPGDDHDP